MKSQKPLSLHERYMQSDWDLLGPNCVTFSFEILHDALQEVMKGERFSEELRYEAKLAQEKLEEIKSFYPKGVKNQIDKQVEQESPPSYLRSYFPESLWNKIDFNEDNPNEPIRRRNEP